MTRKATEGTDDFEEKIVSSFKEYNSSQDPTNLPITKAGATLVRGSYNVYKKLSGTVANRPGIKARGAYDASLYGTKSSFEWSAWDAVVRPMRINNHRLQVEISKVWYTLLSSLADSFDNAVFDSVWDTVAAKDILLMVGGTADIRHWSGANAKFVSAVASTSITLDTDTGTAGFSATGSVLINGTSYAYTGISGVTLTGVTGDASAEVVGSVVMEAVVTTTNTPAADFKNDIVKVISNQAYYGSYTSRAVYISHNDGTNNYITFTQTGSGRLPGEGATVYLDGNVKGITAKDGDVWIGCGTSDWWVISFSQLNVNNVLQEAVNQKKQPTSAMSAPLRHEFIDTVGSEIICLSQDQQVRRIGQFANTFTTRYPTLSLAVQTELSEEDFTGGHLRCIGQYIYITAPVNGYDYIHETRESIDSFGQVTAERFWQPPQVRNISRFALIDGVVYGHSSSNPMIYQIWDTNQWHDDTGTSGSYVPYSSVMLLAYINGGRRQGKINFDKLFVEGYAANADLYAGVYYDYQGATALLNPVLNTSADPFPVTFTGVIPPSLGDASLGDNPLGDGLNTASNDQELLPKFKVIVDLEQIDCFEYALMVYSSNIDSRWEVLSLGVNYELAFAQAVEIVKTK